MVKLEEVPDEELLQQQPGPQKEEEDDWDTDDGELRPPATPRKPRHAILIPCAESEASDVDDDDAFDESLLERLAALKDIVPPTYRKNIAAAAETGYSWASKGLSLSGKTLWVVSTSVLLLGVPWALAFSEEQQVQEMEREMRAQQGANEVCVNARYGGRMSGTDCSNSCLRRERSQHCKMRCAWDVFRRDGVCRFWCRDGAAVL